MNARTNEITGLALLRQPFPAHQISKLPKPYKRDSPKGQCKDCGGYHGLPALHLDYVGHAAITDRLLDADPSWTWEPLAYGPDGLPLLDKEGGLWIKLTVCGVTRPGYGDAADKTGPNAVKERIGDALRNAAMRFGAALDLWHKGDLHDDEEGAAALQERKDKSLPTRPINPTTDAGEGLTPERRQEIKALAGRCLDFLHSGTETAVADATALADEADMDADEAVFFWVHFDSKQRRAMKDEFKARRLRALKPELAGQA